MKDIPLSKSGLLCSISDESYDKVKDINWYPQRGRNGTFYAAGKIRVDGKSREVLMHRYLTDAMRGQEVDHRDGDGLNNQLDNLRVCSRRQNSTNRKSLNQNNTSGYHGVSLCRQTGRWGARIMVDGKQVWLGRFDSKHDAARSYNTAAIKFHGEFATVNKIAEENVFTCAA